MILEVIVATPVELLVCRHICTGIVGSGNYKIDFRNQAREVKKLT